MKKAKKTLPPSPEPPKVVTFETFKKINRDEVCGYFDSAPSCLNGWVRIRRYRVTIEEIEEPKEVIEARLQKLWDESKNWHDFDPLRHVAARLGYTLKGTRGRNAALGGGKECEG